MKNRYISIYLPEFTQAGKKRRLLSIAFGQGDEELFSKLKSISTTEIKKILKIHNYNALKAVSEANFIKPTNYIKQLMNRHFSAKNKKPSSKSASTLFDRWIKLIEKDHPNNSRYTTLLNYLKEERKKIQS